MFEKTLFHQMRVVLQEHTARWSAEMPDLTKPQYAVLEALGLVEEDLHKGLNAAGATREPSGSTPVAELDQATLSEASASTRATLTEMLARMEKRGLIARRTDAEDSRRRLVRLTDKGRETLKAARIVADRVNCALLSPLSEAEHATLLTLLNRLHGKGGKAE